MRRGIAPILALAAVVAAGLAPPARGGDELPDARLGIRVTPLLLLSRADARADLRLSPEQTAGATRTIDDLRDKALELKGRNDAEVVALRGKIDASGLAWIEKNLTPAQLERLAQLDLQWEGPAAVITRPVVAGALGLDAGQRQGLAKLVAEHRTRRRGGPPVAAEEAAFETTLLGQLTDAQRARWGELAGPPAPFRAGQRPTTPVAARP